MALPPMTSPDSTQSDVPQSGPRAELRLDLIQALAQQLGLPLAADQAVAVQGHWLALAAIAHPLMQLDLPQDLDPAPRFEP